MARRRLLDLAVRPLPSLCGVGAAVGAGRQALADVPALQGHRPAGASGQADLGVVAALSARFLPGWPIFDERSTPSGAA